MLPQSFPFQLVDVPASLGDDLAARELAADGLTVRLSMGNAIQRGAVEISPILTLEILAQASIVSLCSGAVKRGFIAGFEAVRFADELAREPLQAGDSLRVRTRKLADLGRLLKVEGEIERDGQIVVRAELMLGFES